jgi:hypothetical protein
MINQDFCDILEHAISRALQHLENDETKGFWCDGILPSQPGIYNSKKHVNDHREVQLKAFIGKDGQTEYAMILKFGNRSLSRYARDLTIQECVPGADKENWLTIDIDNKIIEVQLD